MKYFDFKRCCIRMPKNREIGKKLSRKKGKKYGMS
jgi:hypothetical protein